MLSHPPAAARYSFATADEPISFSQSTSATVDSLHPRPWNSSATARSLKVGAAGGWVRRWFWHKPPPYGRAAGADSLGDRTGMQATGPITTWSSPVHRARPQSPRRLSAGRCAATSRHWRPRPPSRRARRRPRPLVKISNNRLPWPERMQVPRSKLASMQRVPRRPLGRAWPS